MDTYEIIKKIDFFRRRSNDVKIFKISDTEYAIEYSDNKKFNLRMFPIDRYSNVLDKKNKIDILISEGRKLYPILEAGCIEEIECCYRITNQIIKTTRYDSEEKNYELGYYIGETIKKYHELSHVIMDKKWEKSYLYKINTVFHEYSLCDYKGEKDYILMDFVKENEHLIFDRNTIEIFSFNNIRDIPVDENGKIYLFGIQNIFLADPYFEFKDININNYKDEAYSAGIIDGYFYGKPTRLFFKTVALYTIVETLGKDFKYKNEVDCDVMELKMNELSSYYDDFENVYPKWYVEIKKRLMENNNGNKRQK